MSAVTLETLKADHKAKVAAMRRCRDDISAWLNKDFEAWQRELERCAVEADWAAQVLAIAASFDDEQEGLRAAMLWKLSDGAIDPRND